MDIQSTVLFDLLGDSGGILANAFRDLPQRGSGIEAFLNSYSVVLCHMLVVSGYRL